MTISSHTHSFYNILHQTLWSMCLVLAYKICVFHVVKQHGVWMNPADWPGLFISQQEVLEGFCQQSFQSCVSFGKSHHIHNMCTWLGSLSAQTTLTKHILQDACWNVSQQPLKHLTSSHLLVFICSALYIMNMQVIFLFCTHTVALLFFQTWQKAPIKHKKILKLVKKKRVILACHTFQVEQKHKNMYFIKCGENNPLLKNNHFGLMRGFTRS